jgi:hypothetical protein
LSFDLERYREPKSPLGEIEAFAISPAPNAPEIDPVTRSPSWVKFKVIAFSP